MTHHLKRKMGQTKRKSNVTREKKSLRIQQQQQQQLVVFGMRNSYTNTEINMVFFQELYVYVNIYLCSYHVIWKLEHEMMGTWQ